MFCIFLIPKSRRYGLMERIKICFILLLVSLLVMYVTKLLNKITRDYRTNRKPFYINWTLSENISCYYKDIKDVLPPAEDLKPPENSIFFHETSCRGGFNSRQACSVESVARIHPERLVYVFFNSPVSEVVLKNSCLSILTQFKNVRLARLHIKEYAKGTPLFELLESKKNDAGEYRIETASDILRHVTMYKYGGVYLDTDILVVKRLDALGNNWAALESLMALNVAAIAINKHGIGRRVTSSVLRSIKSNFQPNIWGHAGPRTMEKVLLELCATNIVITETYPSNYDCHGFKVYIPAVMYPIHFKDCDIYFKPGELPANSKRAYTHHLWNKLTHNMTVEKGSPYDKLSRKHCPSVRAMYGARFGW